MAVPNKIQVEQGRAITNSVYGGGINYIIETVIGVKYSFFLNSVNNDPSFCKSLDGGITWGEAVALKSMSGTQIAVWYDRWSGLNTDLIHVIYTDSGVDDVFYRNIDTSNNDTLSTETTVFAGASTAAGGALSISRMRGGNLIVVGCIDAGTEIFSKKSTNVGANWSDIAAGYEAAGNADQCVVMPGWGADNQDAMMFYYDRSATEISVKYYDDSANSWSETSIATTISLPDHTTATLGHMAASVDLTNSQNLLVFWTAIDTANADLRCFKVTQSAQTEATNIVLNSTDDQGFCGISILNNKWIVYYVGKTDGIDVYMSNMHLYCKESVDSGATWSNETQCISNNIGYLILLYCSPICYKTESVMLLNVQTLSLMFIAPLSIPRANYILGI